MQGEELEFTYTVNHINSRSVPPRALVTYTPTSSEHRVIQLGVPLTREEIFDEDAFDRKIRAHAPIHVWDGEKKIEKDADLHSAAEALVGKTKVVQVNLIDPSVQKIDLWDTVENSYPEEEVKSL